ncbi:MAG: DUF4410 domain-containing protein [Geobacter sp.]|nr:DUF4410 domain-containing protein [Geobacter sp.]
MKIKGFGLVVLSSMLITGCANTDLKVIKTASASPKTVTLSLVDRSSEHKLQEEILGLKEIVASKLQDEGIKVAGDPKDVVSLIGQFSNYDSGNRALRYFVGFGAGKATYDSNWKLVSATGEEIGNCNVDGWLAMGLFGGSLNKMHEDLAEAVADCVKGKN